MLNRWQDLFVSLSWLLWQDAATSCTYVWLCCCARVINFACCSQETTEDIVLQDGRTPAGENDELDVLPRWWKRIAAVKICCSISQLLKKNSSIFTLVRLHWCIIHSSPHIIKFVLNLARIFLHWLLFRRASGLLMCWLEVRRQTASAPVFPESVDIFKIKLWILN